MNKKRELKARLEEENKKKEAEKAAEQAKIARKEAYNARRLEAEKNAKMKASKA